MSRPSAGRATREVPVRVGLVVAGAAALALLLLFGVAGTLLWKASRFESGDWEMNEGEWEPHEGRGRGPEWQDRVIDLGDVVPVLVLLALASIVFVGVVAWWATRRANEPIERALDMQKRFVADASHELRTPLTTLNSRIQLAQLRLERGGDVGQSLAEMRKDSDAMSGLLTDLLAAAEAEPVADAMARCSAGEACAEAARLTSVQAEQADVHLQVHAPEGLVVRAEKMALVRALVALVDNAIGHSPAGATVAISAQGLGGGNAKQVALRVSDQGPGIPDADPQRLFQRFARGQSAGSRPGSGLGLALVADTAARFGGSASIEQTGPGGTTFVLVLPG